MRKVKKFFEKHYVLLRLRIDMNRCKNKVYKMQEVLRYSHDGITLTRATEEIQKAEIEYSVTKALYDLIKNEDKL